MGCFVTSTTHSHPALLQTNDQKLSIREPSSGDSFTVVSISKINDHDAEEDNDEGKTIGESISEMELSRGDWVLVNYDNVKFPDEIVNAVANEFKVNVMDRSENTFWKWPLKEDKIFCNRSQIFKKLKPAEVAGSWGQFMF